MASYSTNTPDAAGNVSAPQSGSYFIPNPQTQDYHSVSPYPNGGASGYHSASPYPNGGASASRSDPDANPLSQAYNLPNTQTQGYHSAIHYSNGGASARRSDPTANSPPQTYNLANPQIQGSYSTYPYASVGSPAPGLGPATNRPPKSYNHQPVPGSAVAPPSAISTLDYPNVGASAPRSGSATNYPPQPYYQQTVPRDAVAPSPALPALLTADSTTDPNAAVQPQTRSIYGAFQSRFLTSADAKAHRISSRSPPKTKDADFDALVNDERVSWVGEIYDAMTDVSDIVDGSNSTPYRRFVVNPEFQQEDIEAAAHKVFDRVIALYEHGFQRPIIFSKNAKRGARVDTAKNARERLTNVIRALGVSKALAMDAMEGGLPLRRLVYNPTDALAVKKANMVNNKKKGEDLKIGRDIKSNQPSAAAPQDNGQNGAPAPGNSDNSAPKPRRAAAARTNDKNSSAGTHQAAATGHITNSSAGPHRAATGNITSSSAGAHRASAGKIDNSGGAPAGYLNNPSAGPHPAATGNITNSSAGPHRAAVVGNIDNSGGASASYLNHPSAGPHLAGATGNLNNASVGPHRASTAGNIDNSGARPQRTAAAENINNSSAGLQSAGSHRAQATGNLNNPSEGYPVAATVENIDNSIMGRHGAAYPGNLVKPHANAYQTGKEDGAGHTFPVPKAPAKAKQPLKNSGQEPQAGHAPSVANDRSNRRDSAYGNGHGNATNAAPYPVAGNVGYRAFFAPATNAVYYAPAPSVSNAEYTGTRYPVTSAGYYDSYQPISNTGYTGTPYPVANAAPAPASDRNDDFMSIPDFIVNDESMAALYSSKRKRDFEDDEQGPLHPSKHGRFKY